VVALSGIYETALVRELPVNDDVRLSVAEAERWDCLQNMPASGPAYYISAGGAEPSGWIDQSWEMANALSRRGDKVTFHICSGAHHFSLVDRLSDRHNPEGAKLHRWIADH
jgi:arylformamidase